MKATDKAAELTPDLPGIPSANRRGRKPKLGALSNKERQRRWREKHSSMNVGERISKTITSLATDFDLTEDQVTRYLLRFALCNRNWRQSGFPDA